MTKAELAVEGKENVLMRTRSCSITVLPHLGGKIASLQFKGHELLQAPLAPLAPRTPSMSFDAADASGWDECVPSVAPCTMETSAGAARIPDHGDLWRVAWEPVGKNAPDGASMTLRGKCFSLPLMLERTITLSESEDGAHLRVDYMLKNTGDHSVPWSWAAHPLFAIEAGDQILLPASITTMRLEGSGRNRLGTAGNTVNWPVAMLADGSPGNLSIAQPADTGIGDKLFAGPLASDENWCILLRPKAGLRIKMSFDTQATPYLGLWICYGGWPSGKGPKQMCVAPEPSTAPVDSLAQTGNWSRKLAPGATFSWPMFLDLGTI
jgi:galactose mutarotase-like enzyme